MAYIKSIKCFLPPYSLDNNALQEQLKDTCVEKTAKGVGVSKRHIASNDTRQALYNIFFFQMVEG